MAGGNNADSTAGGVTASFTQPENTGDAVPGAAGAVLGLITLSDPDMGDTHTVTVDDGRFQVIDHAGAKWLTLKAGQSLDFEAAASIDLTLTVTDNNGGTDSTTVTITVTDVNEAPSASGELPTVTGTAGEALAGDQTRIDLGMFFSDPDGEDDLTYAASGGPDWLSFEVDAETGHGVLSGTPPAAGADADASHTVTITATDGGGLSVSRSFTLVIDDGNNPITDILFTNADGERLPTNNFEISIDENEEGKAGEGTLLGTFSAVDPDSDDHPNGMITWSLPRGEQRFEIDKDSGELRLKAGVSLDFETARDNISNREIRLEVTATDGGDPALSRTEILYIQVENTNDAPEAEVDGISVGWWVTRDEDLKSGTDQSDRDYAGEGAWLRFSLETEAGNDQRPAFSDVDGARTYTYSLVNSPSWLQINSGSGLIQNRAGMVADEGLYTVTVRATDTGGATDDFTFSLAVAESDFDDATGEPTLRNGSPNDNDGPAIRARGVDIDEAAPAGTVVVRFTVEDEELPIGPVHPWGRLDVDVSSSWQTGTPGGNDYNDRVAQVGQTAVSGDYFSVHHTGTTGDTASYEVRLTVWGAQEIDAEDNNRDDVEFTIRASDGTFNGGLASAVTSALAASQNGADYETVDIRIDDVNEAPYYMSADAGFSSPLSPPPFSPLPRTFSVEQQEISDNAVTRIYLNLTRMFEDPEDGDDITFTAAVGNASWLSLLPVYNDDLGGLRTGPQRWGDIKFGRDGQSGGTGQNVDITWGQGSGANLTDPSNDDDIVLILSVDRDTGDGTGSIAQDANGAIIITATDDDNNSSETTFMVAIGDENLDAPAAEGRVVTLSGPPREGSTLTATFNKQFDPDFTGDEARDENPILVRYQWWSTADPDNDGTDTTEVRQETTENHEGMTGRAAYTVQQSDVGGMVRGRVIYYELFDGEIVVSDTDDDGTNGVQGFASEATSAVQNTPDTERMSFTVQTVINPGGDHVLRITPSFLPRGQDRDRPVDDDGNPIAISDTPTGYTFNYEWQYSPNGRNLWEVIRDADEDAVEANTGRNPERRDLELPESVKGGYVRLVVIYEDEGDGRANQVENRVNRIESDAVKVGEIMHVPAEATGLHIDDSAGAPPTGVVPAGRKLQIDGLSDVPGGSSKVEWLIGNRVVGEDREYTVSASDRGTISATVTRYDADGGLVSKTTTAPVTLTPNAAPILAQPEPHFVDLGKAPDANGKYAMLEDMIDLKSLFKDPEGGPVGRFVVTLPSTSIFASGNGGSDDLITVGSLNLYFDNNGSPVDGPAGVADGTRNAQGDQLLLIDEADGRVEYHTTRAQDHGRNDAVLAANQDGLGNYISLTVTGADSGGARSQGAVVNLRVDAAPTGFQVSADVENKATDPNVAADNGANTDNLTGTPPNAIFQDEVTQDAVKTIPPAAFRYDYGNTPLLPLMYTVREHNSDLGEAVGGTSAGQVDPRVIARIDVQDDNLPTHAYGQYTFSVSHDRFEVVAVRGDASSGILRLKTGQSLDFEALNGGQPAEAGAVAPINLVVTATPVKHPDGSDGHDPITLGITVHVINVDEKTDPNEDDVPGLEDDESDRDNTGDDAGADPAQSTDRGTEIEGDDTDTTDDTGEANDSGDADGDHDGGWWSASDDGLF